MGEGALILRDYIQKSSWRQRKFLLNLADVDYIDSSGLGELVTSFTTVRNKAASSKLLNLTGAFTTCFRLRKPSRLRSFR